MNCHPDRLAIALKVPIVLRSRDNTKSSVQHDIIIPIWYRRDDRDRAIAGEQDALVLSKELNTGRMGWMAHRKWKKIKLQPSMLPGPAVPGSCLASFHFRWAIHPIRPVLYSTSEISNTDLSPCSSAVEAPTPRA